ncbi:MAG: hypothetical protein AUK00_01650 [Dehalococcoidia bacterium CG2_30_46_9]|nr:MAG: hypothetical protein AUK00_01650 [Dehalococcoidia bacterium CG2_30_46_9]
MESRLTQGIQHNRDFTLTATSIPTSQCILKPYLQIGKCNFRFPPFFPQKWQQGGEELRNFWQTGKCPSPKLHINTHCAFGYLSAKLALISVKDGFKACCNRDGQTGTLGLWSHPHINTTLTIKVTSKVFQTWLYGLLYSIHTLIIRQYYSICQVFEKKGGLANSSVA